MASRKQKCTLKTECQLRFYRLLELSVPQKKGRVSSASNRSLVSFSSFLLGHLFRYFRRGRNRKYRGPPEPDPSQTGLRGELHRRRCIRCVGAGILQKWSSVLRLSSAASSALTLTASHAKPSYVSSRIGGTKKKRLDVKGSRYISRMIKTFPDKRSLAQGEFVAGNDIILSKIEERTAFMSYVLQLET